MKGALKFKQFGAITVILFVDNSNFGPVEEGHYVLKGSIEQMLSRMQIDGELSNVGVEIQARFQMRNIKCITN